MFNRVQLGYGLIRIWRAEPLGKPSWHLFVPKDYNTPCPTLLLALDLVLLRILYTPYGIHSCYGVRSRYNASWRMSWTRPWIKTLLRSHNLEIRWSQSYPIESVPRAMHPTNEARIISSPVYGDLVCDITIWSRLTSLFISGLWSTINREPTCTFGEQMYRVRLKQELPNSQAGNQKYLTILCGSPITVHWIITVWLSDYNWFLILHTCE